METEYIQELKNLSERATNHHIIGEGEAVIMIYRSEFHALEEAIQELEEKE